jgi:hypothetical protein
VCFSAIEDKVTVCSVGEDMRSVKQLPALWIESEFYIGEIKELTPTNLAGATFREIDLDGRTITAYSFRNSDFYFEQDVLRSACIREPMKVGRPGDGDRFVMPGTKSELEVVFGEPEKVQRLSGKSSR